MSREQGIANEGLALRRGGALVPVGGAVDDVAPTPIRVCAAADSKAHACTPDVLVLQAVSRALMAWDPIEAGAQYLLAELSSALKLSAAILWIPDGETLLPRSIWVDESIERQEFEASLLGPGALPHCALAELARERLEPLLDVTSKPGTRRSGVSVAGRFQAIVAVPAQGEIDTLGVIVGYSADAAEFEPPSIETLGAAGQLLGDLIERWQFQEDHARLTRRELELLTLASRGLTTAKIAARLSLSPWTVKTHFEHIRLKLQAPDRTAAVAHALRTGMIV